MLAPPDLQKHGAILQQMQYSKYSKFSVRSCATNLRGRNDGEVSPFRSAPYRSKENLYRGSRYTKSGDGPCLSPLFGTRPLTGAFDTASQAVSADMMWSVSRIEKASGVLPDLDLSQLLVERLWRSYVFSASSATRRL
jgi:hypothetical protein